MCVFLPIYQLCAPGTAELPYQNEKRIPLLLTELLIILTATQTVLQDT